MVFSSLEFLFFFLPVVLVLYFILPGQAKNYWLLFASLFFYAWGEPAFFLLLIISIIVNYSIGLGFGRLNRCGVQTPEPASGNSLFARMDPAILKKVLFILALLLNFGALFATKYLNVITSSLRTRFPLWQGVIPQTSFVLPLAISFYTFQSVSYVFDIYRGMEAEKNPCLYALFICFFPQLLQGPIIRYADFRPQLDNRKVTIDGAADGIVRFLTGLNQKVLLANILAEAADAAFSAKNLSVGMAWLGMLAYSLQLYFDFSGYSDMAVGLGQMFGFRLAENFNFPYASKSISEFWRRWHITLGAWFRDYLYIPLGGSRVKTKARLALNLMIVWLATGIWHGADLTFILWGLWHGIFVVFERLTDLPKKLEKKPVLQFLYRGVVLLAAAYGWMLFRAPDFPTARIYTKSLLKLRGNPWQDSVFRFNTREYIVTFVIGIIAAFPLAKTLRDRISAHGGKAAACVRLVWYLLQFVLAVISISGLVMSTHNPFLYANF